ncbi:MAG: Verru_Chthon cassette protein A [Roseimicrobium sp.]
MKSLSIIGYDIKLRRRTESGVALVLVLGTIVVVSMLVLSLLALSRTEQRSSAAFSEMTDARILSELPVNLAIAQIRRATEQNGVDRSWSSQPGMLRVFGTEADSTTGNSDYFRSKTIGLYKLYSDDQMVVTNKGASATKDGMSAAQVKTALDTDSNALKDWQKIPGMYVDINEPAPVVVAGSDKVETAFPISDPRATLARNGGKPVDGFTFDETTVPGTKKPTDEADREARLPMPVRWLYVLADGRMVAPTSGNPEQGLEFLPADAPTEKNPIIGRVAFWTDDESCKLNINTASESRPWDVPRAYTSTEDNYAVKQPVQNEFARYPGHPAQTCLSPVFQAFGSSWRVDPGMSDTALAGALEPYFKISPRIAWGGSKGGTTTATSAITLAGKDARLYANLDELVFDRDRKLQDPPLTHADIALGRFFLTAHSRAPELTVFNKPRVMLWPMSLNTSQRNTMDKLLAFLGTAGGRPWYFHRKTNFKSTTDPGSSQDPKGELGDGSPQRNIDMYTGMLQPYTGAKSGNRTYPVPGFGSTFEIKWGAERRNQVLTEMVDLLRWSVNSYSTAMDPKYYFLPQRTGNYLGESSAVPAIAKDGSRGFGRFPTITEAAIVFVAAGAEDPAQGKMATTEMQAYIILEPFSPTSGPPSWSPDVRYKITGLEGFNAGADNLGFPGDATLHSNVAIGWVGGGHSTPFNGIAAQFKQANINSATGNGASGGRTLTQSNPEQGFPFYSKKINVKGKPDFQFSGGTITVEVQNGLGAAQTVQKLKITFPPARLKIPRLTADTYTKGFQDIAKRFNVVGGDYMTSLIRDGDVTRSVEIGVNNLTKGDLRMVSLMKEVPDSWFTTHGEYGNFEVERLHFLRHGNHTYGGQFGPPGSDATIGKNYNNTRADTHKTAGTLVKGVTYYRDCPPAVPRGLDGAVNADGRPGDFDNGTGKIEDGPYINKADEGNLASGSGGYFGRGSFTVESGASYSPNRQIASAVAFGSLPTGMYKAFDQSTAVRPWQTLLFCPNPPSRSTSATAEPNKLDHEGFKSPRDHLILDLFWMPVVEPYAISEAFSTAGKININYEMIPFRHIERSTGLYGAMKSTVLTAITPNSAGGKTSAGYNNGSGKNYKEGTIHNKELRYLVNVKETLKGFTRRFGQGDVFRSASEICEIFLVPERIPGKSYNDDAKAPGSYEDMVQWWNGNLNQADAFEITGDNSREAPYGQLYPRLTTKSNTFTVHYRVQMLKKARSTDPARWVEGKDSMLSEYRGATVLERYMDPNDKELVNVGQGYGDFAKTWDQHYRFRIVERRQFSP